MRKSEKLLQPPLCRILAGSLQPPLNLAKFGAPDSDLLSSQYMVQCLDLDHVCKQHHHDGCSTAPDEAYSTHQTLSNSPTAAGCYKEGDAPGCTHRGCHQGYQQPTA